MPLSFYNLYLLRWCCLWWMFKTCATIECHHVSCILGKRTTAPGTQPGTSGAPVRRQMHTPRVLGPDCQSTVPILSMSLLVPWVSQKCGSDYQAIKGKVLWRLWGAMKVICFVVLKELCCVDTSIPATSGVASSLLEKPGDVFWGCIFT